MVQTPRSQCREIGLDPWGENQDHMSEKKATRNAFLLKDFSHMSSLISQPRFSVSLFMVITTSCGFLPCVRLCLSPPNCLTLQGSVVDSIRTGV